MFEAVAGLLRQLCRMACVVVAVLALAASARAAGIDRTSLSADPNERFEYVEDGEFSRKLNIPTYEWIPKGFARQPRGLMLMLHGLPLHGKRFEVVGRALAAGNFYAIAVDMRGFGRCFFDSDHKFCADGQCKRKIDYKGSCADIERLARLMKDRYPGVPLYAVGESLGATPAVRLAAEHPELVDGIIVASPAIRMNPGMYFSPKAIMAGLQGLLIDPKFNVRMGYFVRRRISQDPRVVDELAGDPLIRDRVTIMELLKTDRFVAGTTRYARKMLPELPVLILQGSQDLCMLPRDVVKLAKNIRSDEQTLRWMDHYSHLLLETAYLQPAVVDAGVSWLDQREQPHRERMQVVERELRQLGARDM